AASINRRGAIGTCKYDFAMLSWLAVTGDRLPENTNAGPASMLSEGAVIAGISASATTLIVVPAVAAQCTIKAWATLLGPTASMGSWRAACQIALPTWCKWPKQPTSNNTPSA